MSPLLSLTYSSVQQGSLLIDSSTIDPVVAKEVAGMAQKKGVSFVDAPVSGGMTIIVTRSYNCPSTFRFREIDMNTSKLTDGVLHSLSYFFPTVCLITSKLQMYVQS